MNATSPLFVMTKGENDLELLSS